MDKINPGAPTNTANFSNFPKTPAQLSKFLLQVELIKAVKSSRALQSP